MKFFSEINLPDNLELTELAYENCHKNLSASEIAQILKSSDDIAKQACIINLDSINSIEEANLLINNLTNQLTPIREACAFKINQFMQDKYFNKFFQTEAIIDIFLKAINDVNPTVVRNIIDIIDKIEDKKYFEKKLYKRTFKILEELKNFIGIKNHLLNKKTFNLYWCLEAISSITKEITTTSELIEILSLSSKFNDYTIREKTAKIIPLIKTPNPEIKEIAKRLKKDDNLYVRRYFS